LVGKGGRRRGWKVGKGKKGRVGGGWKEWRMEVGGGRRREEEGGGITDLHILLGDHDSVHESIEGLEDTITTSHPK
jgi:hypothetical protein